MRVTGTQDLGCMTVVLCHLLGPFTNSLLERHTLQCLQPQVLRVPPYTLNIKVRRWFYSPVRRNGTQALPLVLPTASASELFCVTPCGIEFCDPGERSFKKYGMYVLLLFFNHHAQPQLDQTVTVENIRAHTLRERIL